MNICVFCASSGDGPAAYHEAAKELGTLIGAGSHTLVFGSGRIGLMGQTARFAKTAGAYLVGVVPQCLSHLAFESCDELIVTKDLRDRKAVMHDRAEAFIVLPGSIGTFDEALEALVLKQLEFHSKPIVFVNTEGFFNGFFSVLNQLVEQRLACGSINSLYSSAATPAQAMELALNVDIPARMKQAQTSPSFTAVNLTPGRRKTF